MIELGVNEPKTLASISSDSAQSLLQCLLAVNLLRDEKDHACLTSVVIASHKILLGDDHNMLISEAAEKGKVVLIFEYDELVVSRKGTDLAKFVSKVFNKDESCHSTVLV